MHFLNEYISKYNNVKEHIKQKVTSIEDSLTSILEIKNINKDDLDSFYRNVFAPSYEIININIRFIIDSLDALQKFCHSDIKSVIPKIDSLKNLDDKQSFEKAKNIDWLIDVIKKERTIDEKLRSNLLEISDINKKVRYFIHSTLSFCENPLPVSVLIKLKNSMDRKVFLDVDDITKDIAYCLHEAQRIRESFEKFHVLSNFQYGDWSNKKTDENCLDEYFNLYKHKFINYFYKNEVYHVMIFVDNKLPKDSSYEFPLVKVKETIDVLMNNAAEELVEKEIEKNEKYDKKIICEMREDGENLIVTVSDNGRGLLNKNTGKAFLTTKNNSFNSGIGLDIARKNMKMMKGNIFWENNFTEGASFKITFPKRISQLLTEDQKHKIFILEIGDSNKIRKETNRIAEEFDNAKIIGFSSVKELNDLKNKDILNFIHFVVYEEIEENLIDETIKNSSFKGKLKKV